MKVEDKPLESIVHDVSSAVLTSIISIIPFVWRSLESSRQMSALVHLSELYRAGPVTRLHTICYIHQAGSWKPWTWMNLASLGAEVVTASKQSRFRVPDVWSPAARHHRQGVSGALRNNSDELHRHHVASCHTPGQWMGWVDHHHRKELVCDGLHALFTGVS